MPGEAFDAGLDRARTSLGMLGDIFVVRALDLDGRFGPGDAASYLSGLQIGHELCEAMARFGSELGRPVQLVCARSEEHTSELQSLMRISYAVFCLKKKKITSHSE